MTKRLIAKRLLKRHNRHASSDMNWAETSKLNLRTPEGIRAARAAAGRAGKASPKAET